MKKDLFCKEELEGLRNYKVSNAGSLVNEFLKHSGRKV